MKYYTLVCQICLMEVKSVVATEPLEMLNPDYERMEEQQISNSSIEEVRNFHRDHSGPDHNLQEVEIRIN